MRSIVVKHGAVEVENECVSISENSMQASTHSQEPPHHYTEARRIFNAAPLPKKAHEDKDDVVIIEEDVTPSSAEAKPYVFPTLDEKENEYSSQELNEEPVQSLEGDDLKTAYQEPIQEPFNNANHASQPELKSLYDDIVSKSIAEASRILEEAHAKAQADYQQLMEKGKDDIKQAKDEGYIQGITEGTRSQVSNIKACIQQLEHTVARIEGRQEEFFASCEQDLKWLALEIAQKVLNDKITEDELALAPLVAAAVAKQKNTPWLTVEISEDSPQLISTLKAELEKGDDGTSITINSVSAPAGTCRMQTAEGFIDASVYRQLDNLREYFSQQPQ